MAPQITYLPEHLIDIIRCKGGGVADWLEVQTRNLQVPGLSLSPLAGFVSR